MDSILESVKKQLGLLSEVVEPDPETEEKKSVYIGANEFDSDIIMNINAAIATLTQLGIGPKQGFTVISSDETYADFLGEDFPQDAVAQVKMYLYYKTKLIFDPPASSAVTECLKEAIRETEWRLNVLYDNTLEENQEEDEEVPEEPTPPDVEGGDEDGTEPKPDPDPGESGEQ